MNVWTVRVQAALAFGMLIAPVALDAQSAEVWSAELPALLDRGEEIRLARSAAPPAVSGPATVLVLERGGYVEAETGTNGVTCYVARSWPGSLEPHCFDREGSATILQIHLEKAQLREARVTKAEAEDEVARRIASGVLKLPRRPVMSYMMSPDQVLYDDDGRRVGQWRPHLMIYVPYVTPEALGLSDQPSLEAAVVVDPGTPEANIMIVVPEFAGGS